MFARVFLLLMFLAAFAPTVRAEEGVDRRCHRKKGHRELSFNLSLEARAGTMELLCDSLEAHFQAPGLSTIPADYITPSTATEANSGIHYLMSYFRVGPRMACEVGNLFGLSFSLGMTAPTITTEFSRNVTVSHPPVTTLLTDDVRETTRLDEGFDAVLGGVLHLHPMDAIRVDMSYGFTYGIAKLHDGEFFLTGMEGQYSWFLHQILVDVRFTFDVEKLGSIVPRLGIGGVALRSKAEFEQTQGVEDWRMEWIQNQGYVLTLGLRLETDFMFGEIEVHLFGERSAGLTFGLSL